MKTCFLVIIAFCAFEISAQQSKTAGAAHIQARIGNASGLINGQGEQMIATPFDKIHEFDAILPGWALVEKNKLLGFIDWLGQVKVHPKYESIGPFGEYHEHWALVKRNGKYGFIDSMGVELVDAVYDEITMPAKPLTY